MTTRKDAKPCLCKCGCGDLTSPGKIFIHNHHARTDLNPFRHLKFEGEKNPFYGRRHTKESLAKMSKARRGKGGMSGIDNPAWRGGKVDLVCEHCGEEFQRWPSAIQGENRFCRRRCAEEGGAYTFKRENHPNWTGPARNERGYIVIHAPGNFMANQNGYVREHRLIMANLLGRPLTSDELVHHINGEKADNRPENLRVMSRLEHNRLHGLQRSLLK